MSIKCGAYRHGKTPCLNDSVQMALKTIPLCTSHLVNLQREIRTAREAGRKSEFAAFVRGQSAIDKERQSVRESALVYFIKAGRKIKIGQSTDPSKRLATIRGGYSTQKPKGLNTANATLLATEPGGFNREQELHKEFAHLRVAGEWFDHDAELKDYIIGLNKLAW